MKASERTLHGCVASTHIPWPIPAGADFTLEWDFAGDSVMTPPITSEREWQEALQDLPLWIPPQRRLIVIAPHPDDETLGAGGLISWQRRHGVPVVIVAATDGDAAYPEMANLAAIRREEQESAAQALGVDGDRIVRLGLPDGCVSAHEDELTDCLAGVVGPDDLVTAPWRLDHHPDHEACGRAAVLAAERAGAQLISYFFWTWHWKKPASLDGLSLRRFGLDRQAQSSKAQALAKHQSQLAHQYGQPILPPVLLEPARRSFEVFLVERDPLRH